MSGTWEWRAIPPACRYNPKFVITDADELKLSLCMVKLAIKDLIKCDHLRQEQRWRENGGKSSLMFYIL